MSAKESKVLSLWEKAYKQNVKNRYLTQSEAFGMIANELNLDAKSTTDILKGRYGFHVVVNDNFKKKEEALSF